MTLKDWPTENLSNSKLRSKGRFAHNYKLFERNNFSELNSEPQTQINSNTVISKIQKSRRKNSIIHHFEKFEENPELGIISGLKRVKCNSLFGKSNLQHFETRKIISEIKFKKKVDPKVKLSSKLLVDPDMRKPKIKIRRNSSSSHGTDSSSAKSSLNPKSDYQKLLKSKIISQSNLSKQVSIDSNPRMNMFRPFSHSFRFTREVELYESEQKNFFLSRSITQNNSELQKMKNDDLNLKLKNLRILFGRIFMFENTTPQIFSQLSPIETDIFLSILKKKKYRNLRKLTQTVKDQKSDNKSLSLFWKMNSDKRKEQNIKFVFRYAIKFLEYRFMKFVLPKSLLISPLSEQENTLLFYLYFFSQTEFSLSFESAMSKFLNDPEFRKTAGKTLQKYIFPKMNEPKSKSRTKTLSKQFFALIGKSSEFVKNLLETIFDCVAHLGDVDFLSNNNHFLREPRVDPTSPHKTILGYIVGSNDKEITKMYSHWENLISKRMKAREGGISETEQELLITRVIKENIKKPSFKLPWSLEELRVAFVQSYLWLLENSTPIKSKDTCFISLINQLLPLQSLIIILIKNQN